MELILDLEEELIIYSTNKTKKITLICHENGSGVEVIDVKTEDLVE